MTGPSPTISAIIPAFEAADVLPRCLKALRNQSAPPATFEVIVVDDGSSESLSALVPDSVTLLRHGHNRGAAAARNSGAAAARGCILLFVDADLVANKQLIAATAELFADGAVVAATGCYAINPVNDGWFAHYKALWTWQCWQRSTATSHQSSHLQGAMAAISREVFEELGGFDERYRGGNVEDYELSERLRGAGHQIAFDERIGGRHHFPSFAIVARNYWHRTRMWLRLKAGGAGFSSGQAGALSGVIALAALCSLACLILGPIHIAFVAASFGCGLTFVVLLAPFLRLAARRQGLRFALYCGATHFALSVVIGAAALSSPLGKGSRDLLPTPERASRE